MALIIGMHFAFGLVVGAMAMAIVFYYFILRSL
jgi:hypothetical protein